MEIYSFKIWVVWFRIFKFLVWDEYRMYFCIELDRDIVIYGKTIILFKIIDFI